MPVVSLQIVQTHRRVENDCAMPIADIVRGIDVVAKHVIVVQHFSPVVVLSTN